MNSEERFEHLFWLQILGDHSRLILNALSPAETKDAATARQFIQLFDQLLDKARGEVTSWSEINRSAYQAALSLRSFKLSLLDRLLLGKVQIGLPPSFLNHMVNELEEYVRILEQLRQGKPVPQHHPLQYDLLWLPDAAGHASAIAADLDSTEKIQIRRSENFEKLFNDFYFKAIELTGYLRTLNQSYPSIIRFHKDVNLEMAVFMKFLKEIEELELSDQLLSRLHPLIPDHMLREECYYLTKLARSGQIPSPNCDPTAPRVVS